MIRRFYQIDSHPSHRGGAGSDGDFNATINLPEMTASERAGLCVVVTKATIPKSFDNVPAGRNTFTLRENATDITITVPVGTYNAIDFGDALKKLLDAATQNSFSYTVTFNQKTGRYRVTSTGNSSLIVPKAIGFGIHTILGLMAGSTNPMPFTSTNKVNYQLTAALQLRSDIVSDNDNILAPIYAAETPYASTISYQATDLDSLAKPLAQKQSGSFRFYVTDVDGQYIDLNGGTVAFELLIYTPLAHLIKNYLNLRTTELTKTPEPDQKQVDALAQMWRDRDQKMPPSIDTASTATAAAVAPEVEPISPDFEFVAPNLLEDYAGAQHDADGDVIVGKSSKD